MHDLNKKIDEEMNNLRKLGKKLSEETDDARLCFIVKEIVEQKELISDLIGERLGLYLDEDRYITDVTRVVYEKELKDMKAKEFFRLLYSGELDELILPHMNYIEFMDDVKERLVTYYEL